jgi:hypothetical protein
MTARIAVKTVGIARQFEAYTYTGDDGYPTAAVFSPVCVTTVDGRDFVLPQGKWMVDQEEGIGWYGYAYHDADKVAERVRVRGSIDPACWVEVEPYRSLEEEAAECGMDPYSYERAIEEGRL